LGFEVLGLLVVGLAEERMRCSGGRRVAFDLVESHRVWLNWKCETGVEAGFWGCCKKIHN